MHTVATPRIGPLLDRAGFFVRGIQRRECWIQRRECWMKKHYLLASDFDQTLSFNDSGIVLSEMLGITSFREKVAALSNLNLVQQGAELAYLLANDPEYARVTPNDLLKVGGQVRLKRNLELLPRTLPHAIPPNRSNFYPP